MRNRLLEAFFIRATVIAASAVGRFRYVRLRAPQLVDIDWTPGQQIRVDCGRTDALMPVLRTYSIWDHQDDWIDLYCLAHGDGPGSRWAGDVQTEDTVLVTKPKGDFVTRTAAFHLFVGDETASAAFGPMIRALPTSAPVSAIVETAEGDQLKLPRDVTWLTRLSPSVVNPAGLAEAVAKADLPEAGVAYLAGEARTLQVVRDVLVSEHGWSRRSVLTKSFWTPGKRGMD